MLERPRTRIVSPELALIAALHQLDVVLIGDAGPALPHAEVVPRDAPVSPVVPVLVSLQAVFRSGLLKKIPVLFKKYFGKNLAFLHSKLFNKEKIYRFHQICGKM